MEIRSGPAVIHSVNLKEEVVEVQLPFDASFALVLAAVGTIDVHLNDLRGQDAGVVALQQLARRAGRPDVVRCDRGTPV